jgi:hypothetical protein
MHDPTITLYVDYRSPYSYLAKDDAYRLEDDFRVRIDWYPYGIDVEGVYGAVEQRTEREWRKVRYLYMDVRRLANARGLIVKGTRKIYDPTLASLGMLYAKDLGVLRKYHDTLLRSSGRTRPRSTAAKTSKARLPKPGLPQMAFGHSLAARVQCNCAVFTRRRTLEAYSELLPLSFARSCSGARTVSPCCVNACLPQD